MAGFIKDFGLSGACTAGKIHTAFPPGFWGIGRLVRYIHYIGHLNATWGDCGVFCRSGMSMYGLKTSWIVGKIHHDDV